MAVDNEHYDINYPLVTGRLSWLRNAQLTVYKSPPEDFVYPCPVYIKKEVNGALIFKFGNTVEYTSTIIPVNMIGVPLVEDNSSTWLVCRLGIDPSADYTTWDASSFEYQLEPCCILWMLEPLKEALQTALEDGDAEGLSGFSFSVGENWTVTGEKDKIFVPDASEEQEEYPTGLYCINGLSGKKIEIKGSKHVNIGVTAGNTIEVTYNDLSTGND